MSRALCHTLIILAEDPVTPGLLSRNSACGPARDACALVPWQWIPGAVIGEEFEGVLAAARGGSEAAFSRLWRDDNPALLHYLRIVAPEIAEDVAADTWLHVVRGLAGFRGNERPGGPGCSLRPAAA